MAIIATDRADFWGFNPMNYLLSYCNSNGLNPANYYAEVLQDGSTGLQYINIHPNGDGGAGALDTIEGSPKMVDMSAPSDTEVAVEVLVNT
jgi:hypothetical protein